jgi:hypothetical protein
VRNPEFITSPADLDNDPDCWAEFIRRQKNTLKMHVILEGTCSWDNHAMGIVNGAIGHQSLETLHIEWECDWLDNEAVESVVDERVGDQLRQILAHTTSLKDIILHSAKVTPEGSTQLAVGIGDNASLQRCVFMSCNIPHLFLTATLEWLLTNQTLRTLNMLHTTIDDKDDHPFVSHLLSRVVYAQQVARDCSLSNTAHQLRGYGRSSQRTHQKQDYEFY